MLGVSCRTFITTLNFELYVRCMLQSSDGSLLAHSTDQSTTEWMPALSSSIDGTIPGYVSGRFTPLNTCLGHVMNKTY